MSFDLDVLERAVWEAEPSQISMCQAKGQSEHLCRNYIRVLQTYSENKLYACGTNAFNPNCTLLQVNENEQLCAKIPFNITIHIYWS